MGRAPIRARTVRRAAAHTSVGVVLALIALGACAKGEDPQLRAGTREDALAFLQQSADKSLAANTFRVSFRITAPPSTFTGTCATGEPPSISLGFDLGTNVGEVYSVDDGSVIAVLTSSETDYVRSSLLPEAWDIDRPWTSFTARQHLAIPARIADATGVSRTMSGPRSTSNEDADPRQMLEQMKETAAAVTEVGAEDVRGVATTRYRIVLDREKMVESAKRQMEETMARAAAEAGAEAEARGSVAVGDPVGTAPNGVEDLLADMPVPDIEAWVDTGGLVRRLTQTYPNGFGGVPGQAGGERIEVELDFFDYGKPLDVGIPPADQVASAGSLPASVIAEGACTAGDGTSAAEVNFRGPGWSECPPDTVAAAVAGKTVDEYVANPRLAFDGSPCGTPWCASEADCADVFGDGAPPGISPSSDQMNACFEAVDRLTESGAIGPDSGIDPASIPECVAFCQALFDGGECRSANEKPGG